MKHIVKYTRPDGTICYDAHGPVTEDIKLASHYISRDVALRAGNNRVHGNSNAFWNSERESAKRAAEDHKGWAFEAIPV